jgi:hypothetical protein
MDEFMYTRHSIGEVEIIQLHQITCRTVLHNLKAWLQNFTIQLQCITMISDWFL